MKIIILGAGQVGASVAENLASEANDITLVDTSPDSLGVLRDRLEVRTVCGNAASPRVLREAGADDADLLIAVTQSDQTNLCACRIAKALFNLPTRIARLRSTDYVDYPELLDEDNFAVDFSICPEQVVTDYIERLIAFPEALQVLEFADGVLSLICVRACALRASTSWRSPTSSTAPRSSTGRTVSCCRSAVRSHRPSSRAAEGAPLRQEHDLAVGAGLDEAVRLGGLGERQPGADLDREAPGGQEMQRDGHRLGAPRLLDRGERAGRAAHERADAEAVGIGAAHERRDARPVGDEVGRGRERLVGAGDVDRGGDALRRERAHAIGEPGGVRDGLAAQRPHAIGTAVARRREHASAPQRRELDDRLPDGARAAGFDLEWKGKAENEVAIDRISGRTLVRVNPKFYRPAEVELLIGNPEKARRAPELLFQ